MGRFNTDRLESKVNNIKTANEQFEKININDIIDCSDNHFPLTEIEELAYDIAERGLDDNLVVGRCNKEVAEHYGVKKGSIFLSAVTDVKQLLCTQMSILTTSICRRLCVK